MSGSSGEFGFLSEYDDRVAFEAGDVVFNVGDDGTEMYVVTSGTVVLRAGGELLDTVEPGGVFGEMVLVDKAPRSATAVAVTDCELVPINEYRFGRLLRREPSFGLAVMRVMAHRLRRRTQTTGLAGGKS